MAKNYVQHGNVLDLPAPVGGVLSGTPYLIGVLFVVAMVDAVAGDLFPGRPEGVWTLPKLAGAAWSVGDLLYWDDTAKNVTKTASTNRKIGAAGAAALSADTTGVVVLVPTL